jgi:tetratricopeptide (TPR) repeat protein
MAVALGCASTILACNTAQAQEWTVTVLKAYNDGVDAYKHGDWAKAKDQFRAAIALQPDKHVEFYEGLLDTCLHSEEWDQVAFASERITQLEPQLRKQVAYDYGMALYKLNQLNEAIPWLKLALSVADQPFQPMWAPEKKPEELIKAAQTGVDTAPPPVPVRIEPPPPVIKPPEHLDTKDYLSIDTAIRSEAIVLATYEGYDKGDIHFNNAPIAHYVIKKVLKGADMNARLNIRYEFHDLVNTAMPEGWKFSEKESMPKKGSEWILFIEFVAAKNNAYETYQGSFGRQPATEENLNKVYGLLDKYNMRRQGNM